MELLIFVIIFTVVSVGLIIYAKKLFSPGVYETKFIKGTARGMLGMFSYAHELQNKRAYVNSRTSKF